MKELLYQILIGLLLILAACFAIDYYELKQSVYSNQDRIEKLNAEQRPLIVVDGNYPYIAVTDDEVLVVEGD